MSDAHEDLTTRCQTELDELNEWGNNKVCENTLTYEEHYRGLTRKRGFDGDALKLVCDECGGTTKVCPVCHGGGWYTGETTGESLACHVCNTREYTRQMRNPY